MSKSAIVTACIFVLFVCLLSTMATAAKPKHATSWQRHHDKRFFGPSRYHRAHKKPWAVRPSKTEALSEFVTSMWGWTPPPNPNKNCFSHESSAVHGPGMGSDQCAKYCGNNHRFKKGEKVQVQFSYFPTTWGTIGTIHKWICSCCVTKL